MIGMEYNFKTIINTNYISPFDLLPCDIQTNNCDCPLIWKVQLLKNIITEERYLKY